MFAFLHGSILDHSENRSHPHAVRLRNFRTQFRKKTGKLRKHPGNVLRANAGNPSFEELGHIKGGGGGREDFEGWLPFFPAIFSFFSKSFHTLPFLEGSSNTWEIQETQGKDLFLREPPSHLHPILVQPLWLS